MYGWHTVHQIGWMQNIRQQLICYSQIHTNEPHYASTYEATFRRKALYIILHVLGNTDMKICKQVTNQWPSQSKKSQLHPAGCVPGRCKLLNPQGRHPTGQGQHSQSHMQVGTGDLAEEKNILTVCKEHKYTYNSHKVLIANTDELKKSERAVSVRDWDSCSSLAEASICEIRHCVRLVFPSTSKDNSAFILKRLPGLLKYKDEGGVVLQYVTKHSSDNTAPHPEELIFTVPVFYCKLQTL